MRRPAEVAPPFAYCLAAFAGCWLVCESLLRPRSLLGNKIPMLAVLAASVPLSLIMETQNAFHEFWRYTHWPWPSAAVFGVPVSVLATWPLQYVVFLTVAAVITPALAPAFFDGRRVG